MSAYLIVDTLIENDSEEYVPVKPLRLNNAKCTLTILDGC